MSLRINHNINALNGQRNLLRNDELLSSSLEKLSSGLKIRDGLKNEGSGVKVQTSQSLTNEGSSIKVQISEQARTLLNKEAANVSLLP